ncbi:hypothetical protein OIU84_011607 [Salix udensis]|uniref:Methyltransferase n=1 Tax=Salix udensis TaxID=889485 RepID=A0AAD6NX68_9ROSI|nr:hypothetical protein OIU84_011607 [Salix udensis]
MDMNAFIGGFAVALNSLPVWELFHDWCEPFSTYPRTYDLLHANHLFTHYKDHGEGCLLEDIMLEMDRIIRPQGFIIIRDEESITSRVQHLAPKFLWEKEVLGIGISNVAMGNISGEAQTFKLISEHGWALSRPSLAIYTSECNF